MALSTGYKIGNAHPDDMGYEVTYPDGYKSWTPKDVADAAYYPLSENNDGTKIRKAMRYVSCLPQLKARNKVYLKLKQIESNYKTSVKTNTIS